MTPPAVLRPEGGPTVADLGEDALLEQVFPRLPLGTATRLGPGDDGAVLSTPDGRVVVSTDVLVEDRHFRRAWSTGEDVGRRAAVQNLADIAAMGARPTSVVVGLVMPAHLPVSWVLGLADGLREECAPLGVGVIGGDLSGGDQVVVAVTVLGDLEGREPVLRSGARPGDVVAHVGVCGRSAAGLAVLLAGQGSELEDDGDDARDELRDAVRGYLRPRSPVALGAAAADLGATAMLDVSDGLLRDAGRIARASRVVLDLERPEVVFAEDVEALAAIGRRLGVDPVEWVLTGGEDHGLLMTFPAGTVLAEPFRRVGTVLAPGSSPAGSVLVEGRPPRTRGTGWDHFRR
ncbi:thiamine-phosphate kinase [Actinotalea sp. K2]|uniref:thiamine-phosphate kinase n=1 Tax=Actinotalea sp. K2 TaxID=2939438 RepID=UPI002017738B|nr:thiamine-phosphate kinase [Actinotalea sp. K2]MCL3860535.1 thiamine-phosphate kinase [Actinotalea sp. K2]